MQIADALTVEGAITATGAISGGTISSSGGTFNANWSAAAPTTAVLASGTACTFFLATRAYTVVGVSCIEATHGTSETIDIIRDTGTNAPGAGTSILSAAMDPHAASNTVVNGVLTGTITLAAGDRLSFKTGGTIGSAAGLQVSALLSPA